MNTLIIDCSAGMSLLLLKDGKEFSFINNDSKKHSDELLVVLDDLLKQAKINVNQINNLCVCIGPGSFTGVRVAISVCKGLAIGTGAKVFVLSNLDIFEDDKNSNYVLVLDGFSEFVYVKICKNAYIENKCLSLSELKNLINDNDFKVYVADEKVQNKLKNIEIQSQLAQKAIKKAFLSKIQNGNAIDLNMIEPLYLRASQAEIERNKKFAGK